MGGAAKATIDHGLIRRWTEERGGKPAAVERTGGGDDPGIIRIDFPGFSGEGTLREISWDQFFESFEANELAFLYQETIRGQQSRFNKLVRRDSVSLGSQDEPEEGASAKGRRPRDQQGSADQESGTAEEESEEDEVDMDALGEEEQAHKEEENKVTRGEEEEEDEDEEEEEETAEGKEKEDDGKTSAGGGPKSAARPRPEQKGAAGGARVDLNRADVEELAGLEGLGRQRAQSIVDYREKNGPFESVDDLKEVSGLSDTLVEKVREQVTLGAGAGRSDTKRKRRAG